MIAAEFWRFLEAKRIAGELTRAKLESCLHDQYEAYAVFMEFVQSNPNDIGQLIQFYLNGYMNHHEVLRKK